MVTTDIQTFRGKVTVASNLTVNTNTLHVDSISGRVGIGKTNPGYTVDVNGILNTASAYINGTLLGGGGGSSLWSLSDSNIYYTAGNVGIGTNSPQKDLEVTGTLRFSNVSNSVSDIYTYSHYVTETSTYTGALRFDSYVSVRGDIMSFTGQHVCFPRGNMKRGLIVSANSNKYVSLNGILTTGIGAIKSNESIPIVSLSNVAYDKNVFGVVHEIEDIETTVRTSDIGGIIIESSKEIGDNRVVVNSIGEGALWVVNTNGPLIAGDYITTSNIMGYGQKQDSDDLKNYTVAKITMDCDFNPENTPVQVIKKDENGINVLDEYGRLQWEDSINTETPYNINYLTINGTRTDRANAIWTAAYVGCTYHCG
jgi:hypothetical protein